MLHRTKQSSGHTLWPLHLDCEREGLKEFFVEWQAFPYVNVLYFEEGVRWCRVMARSGEEALTIARYHHFNGDLHRLLDKAPELQAA